MYRKYLLLYIISVIAVQSVYFIPSLRILPTLHFLATHCTKNILNLHTVPTKFWILAEHLARLWCLEQMQRFFVWIPGDSILLHLLQFFCGDSDYFWDSVYSTIEELHKTCQLNSDDICFYLCNNLYLILMYYPPPPSIVAMSPKLSRRPVLFNIYFL